MAEKDAKTTPITMRISNKLLAALEQLGKPFDIPRTQLIHRAIEEYVERRQQQPTQQKPQRH